MPAYFNDAQRQATKDAGRIAGLDCRASGQRADGGGARLRTGQEEGPDDRGLRLRRRHLRHLDPRGRRGRGRGEGHQRRHPPGRRQHRPADHRVAARRVQEGPGHRSRQRSDGDAAPAGGRREGQDRAVDGARDRDQSAVHHRRRDRPEAPEPPADARQARAAGRGHHPALGSAPAGKPSRTPAWAPGDIDEVVLVGGQTRMPAIQELVKDFFGKEPSQGCQPGRGRGDRCGDPGRRPRGRRQGHAAARRDPAVARHRDPGRRVHQADRAQYHDPDAQERDLLDGVGQPDLGRGSRAAGRARDGGRTTGHWAASTWSVFRRRRAACRRSR